MDGSRAEWGYAGPRRSALQSPTHGRHQIAIEGCLQEEPVSACIDLYIFIHISLCRHGDSISIRYSRLLAVTRLVNNQFKSV